MPVFKRKKDPLNPNSDREYAFMLLEHAFKQYGRIGVGVRW